VVLQVFDDAPLDVVLALTRRGATVTGALGRAALDDLSLDAHSAQRAIV
jgi:hypothetical protein